jgi:hypothetical protein
MTKTQRPRIDLDSNTFRIIVIESAHRSIKPKDLIAQWVKENASPEVLALVKSPDPIRTKKGVKSTIGPKALKDNEPLPQKSEGDNGPFVQSPILPQSLDLLSADEKVVLEHLLANRTYREIETLEKGKTDIKKGRIQSMAQKFMGMGIYQGSKRGPKKAKD